MLKITVCDRDSITPLRSLMTNIGSLLASLVAIGIVFLLCDVNPFYAIAKIFTGSFGSAYGIKESITKAIPLRLSEAVLHLRLEANFGISVLKVSFLWVL